ncbi:MAG: hypothetical protein AAFV80_04230 [Bacteroidota bacterium]
MIRLVLVIIVALTAFYLVGRIAKLINFNHCQNCEGNGYWEGTRGDINRCHACNGTGRKQ